eukprot:SAG22_NODE_717_length_7707_cov_3.098186_4_plen_244_part_00
MSSKSFPACVLDHKGLLTDAPRAATVRAGAGIGACCLRVARDDFELLRKFVQRREFWAQQEAKEKGEAAAAPAAPPPPAVPAAADGGGEGQGGEEGKGAAPPPPPPPPPPDDNDPAGASAAAAPEAPREPAAGGGGAEEAVEQVGRVELDGVALPYANGRFGARATPGGSAGVRGKPVVCDPVLVDTELTNRHALAGAVAVAQRGRVTFAEKAQRCQAAGAIAVVFGESQGTDFLLCFHCLSV